MSGHFQGAVPPPPPPPPAPQAPIPMGHVQGQQRQPQPLHQVNPMMEQFRAMHVDPQSQNIAAHPSRIPQPINFPVTYEGWIFRKVPLNMLPPGETQGWKRATRIPMPVDTNALMQQIKAKQKSRNRKTAMEEYNALKTDSLRDQVDRLIDDQTRQEMNPHAEWKLASVETETRRLDARSTEIGVLRVILKRQPKLDSRGFATTMFPGEIVDVQNPARPKDAMGAAKFARSQQQPAQPQPQLLFDPMQRQHQGPPGPEWLEPVPPGFIPPPPPLPQQFPNPNPTQGMQQRLPPPGVTVVPQQQGPAGMSTKRLPQVQPINIPQQGRPMTPQPMKKAKKLVQVDYDYDSESPYSDSDSDEIVEIVDEKIQKSKKVGEHGTTSKVKVKKTTQHSFSPPPMGVYTPKAPKKDHSHDHIPRRQSMRNLNRAPTPPVDRSTQRKVQKIVQEWHMAPDDSSSSSSSSDNDWRRADGGSSQFSTDSSRTIYTPASSPRAPKATPYISHHHHHHRRRGDSFDSSGGGSGRHGSHSPDHRGGPRPPHHRHVSDRADIIPSTSYYRPRGPERRLSYSDRPRERPYLHQRASTHDDYPGTVAAPRRLEAAAAAAAEGDEHHLADARYDRVRRLEAERAEEAMWEERRRRERRVERERRIRALEFERGGGRGMRRGGGRGRGRGGMVPGGG